MQKFSASLINETGKKVPNISWEKIGQVVGDIVGHKLKNVSIIFVSRSKIQGLNSRYRGKDKATNVLSFSDSREIILSPAIVKKEASEMGLDENEWFTRLFIHSLLHLEGYNHQQDEDAIKMENLEELILKRCKNGSPENRYSR